MSSLRTRLLLFSVLLVIVPGAVFGLIAISNGRATLTNAVGRQLAEEARGAADSLSATVVKDFVDLRTYARQDLMREIRIGDLDKRISAFLLSLRRGDESILDLQVTDPDGRVVASTHPQQIGTHSMAARRARIAPQEWIRGPIAPGDGLDAGLELSVPIPDPDRGDSVSGRLIAHYDWARQTSAVDRARRNLVDMGLDADVLIVDPAGRVIGGAMAKDSATRVGSDLGAAGWTVVRERANRRPPGYAVDRGAAALVGFADVAAAATPWTVLVTEPLSEALAPVDAMTRRLVGALATVLAAALGLAVLLARRIVDPLRDLTRATRRMASGEWTASVIAPRSHDEVGELAAAFNQLSIDLRRAQDEVLEATRLAVVGELAAGIAHEVRTALGVLRSSAQILQPSLPPADAEAAELIQIMLDEIDHLDGVVTQLLNLGRPRQLAIAPSPLADIVFRAVDFAEPQARAKEIVIGRVCSRGDAVALCDEEQIYQVALNLVVNALQVVRPGGRVTVEVRGEREGMVGFAVADDGPGVPPEVREKIFLPFFSLRDGGAGLGLTLVRRIVNEHHGKIAVESDGSQGSRFTVELPAAAPERSS